MADGYLDKQVPNIVATTSGLTKNSTYVTGDPQYLIQRCGNTVLIRGYMEFTSSMSGTYRAFTIFTGAPPAYNYTEGCGVFLFDSTSTDIAFMTVNANGEIVLTVRGIEAKNKKGMFYMNYIARQSV